MKIFLERERTNRTRTKFHNKFSKNAGTNGTNANPGLNPGLYTIALAHCTNFISTKFPINHLSTIISPKLAHRIHLHQSTYCVIVFGPKRWTIEYTG